MPQLTPVGLLVTVPWPVPVLVAANVCLAVTACGALVWRAESAWFRSRDGARVLAQSGHGVCGSGGPENDFTNRNTTFLAWNLMHVARMLKDAGGIPAHGNQKSLWDAGCRFDYANPDYR